MTFATLRRPDGYGLGLRTDRGVLEVVAPSVSPPTELAAGRRVSRLREQ